MITLRARSETGPSDSTVGDRPERYGRTPELVQVFLGYSGNNVRGSTR